MQPQDIFNNNILHLLQAHFSSHTRLYDIAIAGVQEVCTKSIFSSGLGGGQTFMVEGWCGLEALHSTSNYSLLLLSTNAHYALPSLLGKTCTLYTVLSDGARSSTSGLITQAEQIGSEGGLARYRLNVADASWMLGQCLASRAWQDTTVLDIIASILDRYAPTLSWRLSDEVGPYMQEADQAGLRSYCVQYRQTDLAFVSRLLAEEGLSWRVQQDGDAASGHTLVIFADSSQPKAFPEDSSSAHSLGGAGIRFHRGQATQEQDTIEHLHCQQSLLSSAVTVVTTDYKTRRTLSASAPTAKRYGGKNAPAIESYLPHAPYHSTNNATAQRQATLHMQALEARYERWFARSTVRTLHAGSHLHITQSPLPALQEPSHPGFNALSATHVGINNLPKVAQTRLAQHLGDVPTLLGDALLRLQAPDPSALLTQAAELGYANRCELIRADVVWRPFLDDDTLVLPKAAAPGAQTALVVGPSGSPSDTSAGDVYTDALGRVRIVFPWQGSIHGAAGDADGSTSGRASCWVRVAQRSAGSSMGLQFIPRVGQEVLVQFLGGDIDRPLITGALYNGQGMGGVAPTPGGASHAPASQDDPFASAHDIRASGQTNQIAGSMAGVAGNSPTWFGSHANAAAQWGIRTQEWGSSGYNQLVFDDTDAQQRIHFKTTQYASELSLGHLIHTADNYRGSLRGQGFELRTDAYGAVRAGAGLMLTTYALKHSASSREPAGDNTAALALLKQAKTLTQAFSDAARTHQTVALSSHVGTIKAGASAIDDTAAPLAALHRTSAAQVRHESWDSAQSSAQSKTTAPSAESLPHSADATISVAGQGGVALVAGQAVQAANSETFNQVSGQDTQAVTGGQLRIHSGQAIGMLGGAVAPGEQGKGLTLIAAQGPVRYEAQSDQIKVQAKELINIQSANAHIDWAAAKRISLSTAGGANITIDGGNITIQCPGNLTVHAGMKSFDGPGRMSYSFPILPRQVCVSCLLNAAKQAAPFAKRA